MAVENKTPYQVMLDTINQERYAQLVDIVDKLLVK
jgi:hypothetical protein